MNIWALACIIRAPNSIALDMMEDYEKHCKALLDEEPYAINDAQFEAILSRLEVHPSDRDVFEDYFRLLDKRNRGVSNLRHVLICIAMTTAKDLPSLFLACLKLMDRQHSLMINKADLVVIFKTINDTSYYVGDKYLPVEQVYDLVNSVFTSCGKIDGDLYYPDILDYLCQHPLVQLFVSRPFQGTIASKLLSEEEIEAAARTDK